VLADHSITMIVLSLTVSTFPRHLMMYFRVQTNVIGGGVVSW